MSGRNGWSMFSKSEVLSQMSNIYFSLAPASLSTSDIISDHQSKSITDGLFSPHINWFSSIVEASLSLSSLKSHERLRDSPVEVIEWYQVEKGPTTFRSLVDVAHAMVCIDFAVASQILWLIVKDKHFWPWLCTLHFYSTLGYRRHYLSPQQYRTIFPQDAKLYAICLCCTSRKPAIGSNTWIQSTLYHSRTCCKFNSLYTMASTQGHHC